MANTIIFKTNKQTKTLRYNYGWQLQSALLKETFGIHPCISQCSPKNRTNRMYIFLSIDR